MKLTAIVSGVYFGLGAVVAAPIYSQTEPKYVIVNGEVVRYEPGSLIIVRGTDNREIAYSLGPTLSVPSDVQVGRRVTLYAEPGPNGDAAVTRVVTTSVTPGGQLKRTTEETRTQSGITTKTTTTEISGKVEAYATGKTLTISRADGTRTTYILDAQSKLPADLVIGRQVTIEPIIQNGHEVARVVTYTVRQPS